MREFFIGLCAFTVIGGMLRSFVSEENFARIFSLISGILILIIIISVIPELQNDINLSAERGLSTEEHDFDGVVISKAEEGLSDTAEAQLLSLFGVQGEITVSLSYIEERIEVSDVHASVEDGERERVRQWLCEYFEVEEGAVNFN